MDPGDCLLHPQQTCRGNAMLQLLGNSLDPEQNIVPPQLKDPIFVSIDVGLSKEGCLDTIGIASLDIRLLADSQTKATCIFGETEYAPPEKARDTLRTIFSQPDKEQTGFRNIILVGHHIDNDMRYLKATLGFDLKSMPSIVAIIDAQQMVRCVFNFQNEYTSLKRTLHTLGIKAIQLHNSGNDAVYALKLSGGALSHQQDDPSEWLWRNRLDLLKRTADYGVPGRPTSLLEVRRAKRPTKPPRVDDPDLLDIDTASDRGSEGVLTSMFGDD